MFSAPEHPYTRKLLGYLDYKKGRGHNHRSAASDEPVLSVRKLCKSFRLGRKEKNDVLKDFSMDIYRGEIVGLVGSSGCGKSTLARCIAGIDRPDSGVVEFAGGIRMQMIFQDSQSAFNDRFTVKKIIEEPLRTGAGRITDAGRRDEAVRNVMRAVELDESLADRKPYELSGGQRQRAAVARALITDPDFIIADEPLTGLDVSAQAQIVHLLKRLAQERGLTILFIAHDLPMVNHISSRIIEM